MNVLRKKPTPLHEPLLKELVIPDLQDAALTGIYDQDVLLFQQDCYVARALREKGVFLRAEFQRINETNLGDGLKRDSLKREAVIEAARALYAELKAKGEASTGVRGFAGAAGIYLKGAIVDYHTYLLDLAEHIDQAVKVGHTPDINWLSGHSYAVIAKSSRLMDTIDKNLGKTDSLFAEKLLESGVRAVGSPLQDAVAMAVGKRIWQVIDSISNTPQAYVTNDVVEPPFDELSVRDVWDISPMMRQEFEP